MKIKKVLLLLLILGMTLGLIACSNDTTNVKEDIDNEKNDEEIVEDKPEDDENEVNISIEYTNLIDLFSTEIGMTYYYSGAAEYGHTMTIVDKSNLKGNTLLTFQGYMADGLGPIGENGEERNFLMEYEIGEDEVIERVIEDERGLQSSIIPNKIVVKAPIKLDTTWEETFTYEGKGYTAVSKITKEEYTKDGEEDVLRIVVETIVNDIEGYKDNTYTEIRTYELGKGLVNFEQNFPGYLDDNGEMQYVGYNLGYYLYKMEIEPLGVEELTKVFPTEEEFTWYYHGYAEYGHIMSLEKFEEGKTNNRILIKGYMNDGMEDPDPNGKRTFTINYDIDNYRIREYIHNNEDDSNTLNSIIHDKVILRMPLVKENRWEEYFTYKGNKYVAFSIIDEVRSSDSSDTLDEYVVKTVVENIEGFPNNTYSEKRVYRLGYGLVSFSNTWSDVEPFTEDEPYNFGYGLSQTNIE